MSDILRKNIDEMIKQGEPIKNKKQISLMLKTNILERLDKALLEIEEKCDSKISRNKAAEIAIETFVEEMENILKNKEDK